MQRYIRKPGADVPSRRAISRAGSKVLRGFRSLLILLPAFALGACASHGLSSQTETQTTQHAEPSAVFPSQGAIEPQQDAAAQRRATLARKSRLRKWAQQQDRLYAVASPLLLKNAAICKKKTRLISGIVVRTKYSYSNEFVDAAEQELGLSERPQVVNVMSGSGADKSGIRRGDILLAVGDHNVSAGQGAEAEAARLMAAEAGRKSSVKLTLSRDGSDYVVDMALTRVCDVKVELGNSDDVNAYSDGKRSLITAGMLDYVQSDSELAIVAAKEIAHNIVAQGSRPHMATTINDLRRFGIAMASSQASMKIRPYTAVRDATADKYSIYFLARAGHDIDKVSPFWKRLASRFPATQLNSYTALHPSTSYRISVITAVANVVRHTRKHGWSLIPH